MLPEAYMYVLINFIFSVNVLLGTLENSFVKQRTGDLACDNSSAPTYLGAVGNVIACSRSCSSMNGCRGFHFNEANGACWGSNQTECQTVTDTAFYRKERHDNQQTNTTTTTACAANCTSTIDCGVPVSIPNAVVSAGGTLNGDTRTYSCSTGYVLRNVVTLDSTCQPDTTWSVPSFDCLWDCGAPPSVTNAAVSAGDTVEATTREYTCGTLYEANGTATVTCQTGATWSAVAFSCGPGRGLLSVSIVMLFFGTVCPSGWYQIASSCYLVHSPTILADQIWTFCNDSYGTYPFDTYMLQLETSEETVAVKTFLQPYSDDRLCLGLYDSLLDGNWKWMATGDPLTFSDWSTHPCCSVQPNGGQRYAELYLLSDLQWHDIGIGYLCSPICELRLPY